MPGNISSHNELFLTVSMIVKEKVKHLLCAIMIKIMNRDISSSNKLE